MAKTASKTRTIPFKPILARAEKRKCAASLAIDFRRLAGECRELLGIQQRFIDALAAGRNFHFLVEVRQQPFDPGAHLFRYLGLRLRAGAARGQTPHRHGHPSHHAPSRRPACA